MLNAKSESEESSSKWVVLKFLSHFAILFFARKISNDLDT